MAAVPAAVPQLRDVRRHRAHMTFEHFQSQVRRLKDAVRLMRICALVSPFLIWGIFRLCERHTSEVFAGWLLVMLIGLWAVVPTFILSRKARALGLFCPACGERDYPWSFIRRVQRDGRCPTCNKEVLSAA